MDSMAAILELLKEHPVEMGILIGFIAYLFREPISGVLPELIKKKLKSQEKARKIDSFYNAKKRIVYDLPERIVVVDVRRCESIVGELIQNHRQREEEIVFNFSCTRVINKHFYTVFSGAIYAAIEENNIGIKIIFPKAQDLSEDMMKLKFSVENAVKQANTKTVQCKEDERRITTGSSACQSGLMFFDDDGKIKL
jgi:hypothetical protein